MKPIAPLRILHLESGMNWGGQEYRTQEEIAWLNRNGHFALLACQPGSESSRHAGIAGIPHVEIPMRRSFDPQATARIWCLCRREAMDLLHAHGSDDAGICIPLHVLGFPVVRSRHINFEKAIQWSRHWKFRFGCRRVIATAEVIREDLIHRLRIPPDRVDVIGEGIDLARFAAAEGAPFRKKWGVPPDAPLLGIVGMIRNEKGQREFVEAAAEVLKSAPGARFVVVGEGTGARSVEQRLHKRARALFGSGSPPSPLIFAGYEADIPGVLAALDILAVPSLMEAQSRVVPEAFASGRAVIASRVGGLPELVTHEKNGLLVPPGDVPALAAAMLRLIQDPELRARLAAAGRQTASSRLGMDRMMQETLTTYHRARGKS